MTADKINIMLAGIILLTVLLISPTHAFAKSSGSHGQSGSPHGNSAFGHSHNTSTVTTETTSSSSQSSVSDNGGGGRDFIFPCTVNFQYRDFYQYQSNEGNRYEDFMHDKTLQILQFYENYKHTGKYCGTPILEFGDLS